MRKSARYVTPLPLPCTPHAAAAYAWAVPNNVKQVAAAAYVWVHVEHTLARVVHHVVVDGFGGAAQCPSITLPLGDVVDGELFNIFQLCVKVAVITNIAINCLP